MSRQTPTSHRWRTVHQYPRGLDGSTRPVKEWLSVPINGHILLQISDLYSDSRQNALSVAKALVMHVYLLFGCPILQISDMGGEFQNDVMRNIADLLGIQLNRTTAYRLFSTVR